MKVFDNILSVPSHVPAVITASANGVAVDTKGYHDAMLQVCVGDLDLASGNETYVVTAEESDDGSTGWAAISGVSIAMTADNTAKEARISNLNGGTRKRYLRAVATLAGTTPSMPLCTTFIMGEAESGAVGNA